MVLAVVGRQRVGKTGLKFGRAWDMAKGQTLYVIDLMTARASLRGSRPWPYVHSLSATDPVPAWARLEFVQPGEPVVIRRLSARRAPTLTEAGEARLVSDG